MARATKKKGNRKASRATTRGKTAMKAATRSSTKSATSAKSGRSSARKTAAPKIDPLNRKAYPAITPTLTVRDIRASVNFYSSVFGFTVHQVNDTPQGIMHAELKFRDSILMLGPEQGENRSATAIGNTPVTLYLLVEDVDKVFERARDAGAKIIMPVSDMFWGDRCGTVADLEGNKWMIATHKAEPTEAEMAEAMRQMSQGSPTATTAASAGRP
jgi:PhnB protein